MFGVWVSIEEVDVRRLLVFVVVVTCMSHVTHIHIMFVCVDNHKVKWS